MPRNYYFDFDVYKFPRKIQSHNRITVAIGCFLSGNYPKMNGVSKESEIAKLIVSMNSEVKAKTRFEDQMPD